jgi:hypothetical protein
MVIETRRRRRALARSLVTYPRQKVDACRRRMSLQAEERVAAAGLDKEYCPIVGTPKFRV